MTAFRIENKSKYPVKYRDKVTGRFVILSPSEEKLLTKIPEYYDQLKEACIIEPIRKRKKEKEAEELEKQITKKI